MKRDAAGRSGIKTEKRKKRAAGVVPGKLTGALLVVSAGQLVASVCLFASLEGIRDSGFLQIARICVGLILLSSLLSIAGLAAAAGYRDRNYAEAMGNLEELNRKLREQKHDLMNHFQVVYGLMELGEYEEAGAYIRPVFKSIQKLNRALKTAQPAVNALLQAKMDTAEQKGIDFYLEVGTALSDLPMQPWDFCRVLANLLDNAMTALEAAEGEKRLTVRMKEAASVYRVEVENNGPAIEPPVLPYIFQAGFTTKREDGHGQGLAIVSRLVKDAGGTVSVDSADGLTVFLVELPVVKKDAQAVKNMTV